MRKIFEIPTIEKINFKIQDSTMCNDHITSGVTSDSGVITEMTFSQSTSMTEK